MGPYSNPMEVLKDSYRGPIRIPQRGPIRVLYGVLSESHKKSNKDPIRGAIGVL